MPWVRRESIIAVLDQLAAGAAIAAPLLHGRRGHPVGFSARYRSELLALRGDTGARALLAAKAHHIVTVAVDDPGVLRDVDTPADLAG
jgi:molybdenum cofactor cytidylyltransferase